MEVEILQQQQPTTPMKIKDINEKMIQEVSPDQSEHSTITSTNQQQANLNEIKDNSTSSFPQLFCYEHKSPIILVCQKKNCQQRPFLCARCVSANLAHMNSHDPFIMYEDFVDYLKTLDSDDKQANTTTMMMSTEANISAEQQQQAFNITENEIQTFQQNQEKQIEMFTEKMAEFKTMYEQNFDQFMNNMKQMMMEQTKILQRNYEKMNYMKQIDFEMEAEIPNFFEIKQNCLKMNDAKDMEQYLIQVLRRKQQWQAASDNVKTIGTQTIKFYENSIQKQIQNQPSFQNLEVSAQAWRQELTQTFQKFQNSQLCFENLYNNNEENFQIKLDKVSEIKLMTNSMLKPEIQLFIDLAEKTISSEEFDEMLTIFMKLYSMQYIDFDFSQSTLPSFEYIGKMLHIFKSMTKLNYLGMSLYGCGMNDKQVEKITESMSLMKNITEFIINVGNNPITQTGMVCFSSSLREMDQLKHLKFGYTNNKAKCQGLMMFAESLGNMKSLETLEIDFSGFSQKRNNIKDQGFIKLMQVLSTLKMLKKIHLDFGYNQITDEGIYEMCNTIKQLPYLNDFYINFNKCAVSSEKAMHKLGKIMGRMTIERIHINLNSNQIGDAGCYKFVMGMKQAMFTKYLKINFRNVGMSNEKGLEMRNELLANTNFKQMEFFF